MSHKQYIVELSSEERADLQRLTSTGSPKTQARRRAQIWLLCDQGPEGPAWTDERTAEAVGVTAMTVTRARRALVEEGLEAALARKPRPPRPPKLDGAAEAELVRLACSTPPPGRARWTLKLLAAELVALEVVDSIAPETVRRTLKKNALKPWRHDCWCIPPQADAAFVHNMEDVLEVYRRPPDDRFPVVCVDESSKQLVAETRIPRPTAPGQPARYDYEYRRNGVRNLFMVTAPQQGWRTVQVTDRRTKLDFAAVLRDLADVHFPEAEKIVLVCDNLNTHHPSVLYEAFPAHRRAPGVALHAQARQLAQHRRNRVRGPGRAVPGPAHRQRGCAADRNRGLGAGAQRPGHPRPLAVHDRGRPHQAATPVPHI